MFKRGGAMLMLSAFVADPLLVSATRTVKLEFPGDCGVPVIAPAALSARPAGKDPAVRAHVYDPDPPVAFKLCEYGTPTVPAARPFVVIATAGGAMAMLSALVANPPPPVLVARTVNCEVPAASGVPLIVPVGPSDSPPGMDPPDTVHEYDP